MRKRVADILNVHYVEVCGEQVCACEPSPDEIERDVRENNLENRGFQTHLEELMREWNNADTFEGYCERVKGYHSRRIAFFVKNGWSDQIILKSDGCTVHEGLHRLKAATYLNLEYVDVTCASA